MNKFLRELEIDLKIVLGSIIIIIGIIGLFLPIIPGMVLIFIGLFLIGGKHLINKIKKLFKRN